MAYDDIYKGYREATRGLEEQAVQERERVTREYDTQREKLQEQLAKSEREVQRTLGELRSAERREQRRADLPYSKPRDIATRENVEAVRAEGERFSREMRDLQGQVSQARSESLTDIQQQVSAGKAKIKKWYRKAKAAQRKADRAAAKAEHEAEATVQPEKRVVVAKAPAKYQDAATSPFTGATARGQTQAAGPFTGAVARGNTSQQSAITWNSLREVGLSAIPVYGTIRYAQSASKDGFTTREKAWVVASVVGDVAILVPAVKGTVVALRSGVPLAQLISKGAIKKFATAIVKDEKGGVAVVDRATPITKRVQVAVKERNPSLDKLFESINAATRQTEVADLLHGARTATAKRASQAAYKAGVKRAENILKAAKVRRARIPAVSATEARNITARQAKARANALGSLRKYREASQRAAEARRVVPPQVAQQAINAVAATGNVAATREVLIATAAQILQTGRGVRGIEQAAQQAIARSVQEARTHADTETYHQLRAQAQARAIVDIAIETIAEPSKRIATVPSEATGVEIATQQMPAVAPLVGTATATATATLTETDTLTKSIPTTRVRTTTVPGSVPDSEIKGQKKGGGWWPTPPIRLKLPDGTSITLTRQQYAGIVAWRQGLFYILVYPPYGKAQTVYTRKPIAGIRYARGPESPQRSAAVIGGKLPRSFEVAMGIAKVRITPHTKTQPRLTFRSSAVPELGEIRKVKKRSKQ